MPGPGPGVQGTPPSVASRVRDLFGGQVTGEGTAATRAGSRQGSGGVINAHHTTQPLAKHRLFSLAAEILPLERIRSPARHPLRHGKVHVVSRFRRGPHRSTQEDTDLLSTTPKQSCPAQVTGDPGTSVPDPPSRPNATPDRESAVKGAARAPVSRRSAESLLGVIAPPVGKKCYIQNSNQQRSI